MMKKLQNLGKALMQPVAILPVAALFMGIGYWIDPNGWGAGSPVAAFFIKAGGSVLDMIGILFAVGVAYGLAKDKNGAAALSGLVGFLVVTTLLAPASIAFYRGVDPATISVAEGWGKINNGNVFIGIITAIIAAWCYNRFHNVKLHDALAFFSGRRLVPILTAFFSILASVVLYFIWPIIYSALVTFGEGIMNMGAVGAGIYGLFNRLLIPTGLHHALNAVFWFDIAGINDIPNFIGGAKSLAEGTAQIGITGMYQAGFFPIMMFGLPGAALAMYQEAKPQKKKVVMGLMIAGAFASFFTGVTEPLEFSFMFLAPLLYLMHAILTGISVAIAAAFHWTAGFGFSAGVIDFILSMRNPVANKPYMLLVMGVVFFAVYYLLFRFAIRKWNIITPGREDDDVEDEKNIKLSGDVSYRDMAETILKGLGGKENIEDIDYCATRLRCEIKDYTLVNEKLIRKAGVAGVIRPSQKNVQVVIGPQVQFVHDELKTML